MIRDIDWEAAINVRRSTRSFEMRPVEKELITKLQILTDNIQVPFEHNVEIRFFKANPDNKLYTVFTSPPDGAAFLADTDVCSISKAGFVGEILILYATSLGLATCWYGHYTLAELERIMPHLGPYASLPHPRWGYGKGEVEGRRAICINPLGYWRNEGVRLGDRFQESFFSFKRKPVSTFLEEGIKEDSLPPELLFALDLARKAPSAANSQFWRFNVSPDFKTITIAMPVGYKHFKWEHPNVDIGICACHFWLGLKLKNMECRITLSKEQERAVWRFEL